MKKILPALVIGLILAVNVARFYRLAEIPAGYHVDEYSAAVTTRCFALEGTNAWGGKGGWFFSVAYGSPRPAVYVWPAALIGKIFGFTVVVLRAFTALMVVSGIGAIFLIGRKWAGVNAGLFAALSASLAPHIFVMSRVGYESLMAVVFLAWAFYLLQFPQKQGYMAAAAVCLSLCAFHYPPARLFLPLFLTAYYILFRGWTVDKESWMAFVITLGVTSLPLIHAVVTDEALTRRFQEISITNAVIAPDYSPLWFKGLIAVFVHNYLLHLSGKFLFLNGDASAVHSTTHHGIFSYLDYMAWALGIMMVGIFFMSAKRERPFMGQGRRLSFCAACFFLAIVPSALTLTEIPNALRISLHWPFTSLLTGLLVSEAQKRIAFSDLAAWMMGAFFAAGFASFYFRDYAKISTGMFHDWVVNDAQRIKTSEDWFKFLVKYRFKDYHTRYFLMNKQGKSCMESLRIWTNVYNNLGRGKRY
jgi:hypothetical protein